MYIYMYIYIVIYGKFYSHWMCVHQQLSDSDPGHHLQLSSRQHLAGPPGPKPKLECQGGWVKSG